jgi:hypothetical protein
MYDKTQREAFSLLTAIIIILLMSSVGIFVMNLSAKMTRETTAQFQREQAMLYAKSYTEYAIMAVTGNDRNGTTGSCLRDIDATLGDPENGGYKVEVRLAYIGHANEVGDCAATRTWDASVTTAGSPLNVIVDVYVKYKEPDHPDITHAPFITYHKRTLQKI